MSYNVFVDAQQNILSIQDADTLLPVQWTDPKFIAWNQALQTPYVLSVAQTFLQNFKSLTPVQWAANQGITAANKDAILQGMLKTYSIGVI